LREASAPFNEFYGNEIEPLNLEIHWFHDPNLFRAAFTVPSADFKTANITLRVIPKLSEGNTALQEDAFTIAHELATLVVGPSMENGWDIACTDKYGVFSEILKTPLRDHKLAQYGFDTDSWLQSQLNIFTTYCIDPTDPLILHAYDFSYALFVLYWQYVLNHDGVPSKLNSFCQECCPNVQEEGTNILAMVNGIGGLGDITPDSAKALYEEFISKYSLPCHIITFSQAQ